MIRGNVDRASWLSDHRPMGLRFQRRVRILPGVTINLSKSGVSTSLGTRGAHVTIGHGKVRETVGLPGTGVSYTQLTPTSTSPRLWPRLLALGALLVVLVLIGLLSGCDNKRVDLMLADHEGKIERLQQQQVQLQAEVAAIRASAPQWTLWRQSVLNNPPGWTNVATAEDAFPTKDACLVSARSRLLGAGARLVSSDPVRGRFPDRLDNIYCLPSGTQPQQAH